MIRMEDNKGFKPHVPETYVVVNITKREAVLLQKLRRSAYGKITVHKMDGVIVRVETNSSELIDESSEIDL